VKLSQLGKASLGKSISILDDSSAVKKEVAITAATIKPLVKQEQAEPNIPLDEQKKTIPSMAGSVALLRIPNETDQDYQNRCNSHYDLLMATKTWKEGQPLLTEEYKYPIQSGNYLYYPQFKVAISKTEEQPDSKESYRKPPKKQIEPVWNYAEIEKHKVDYETSCPACQHKSNYSICPGCWFQRGGFIPTREVII